MEQKSHYQGDMVLDTDQMRLAKTGNLTFGSMKYRLWPRNIPYDYADSFASSAKAVSVIQAAFYEYEKYSWIFTVYCLVPSKEERTVYLFLYSKRVCTEYVQLKSACYKIHKKYPPKKVSKLTDELLCFHWIEATEPYKVLRKPMSWCQENL